MIGMDSTARVPVETRKAMMAIASVTWEDEGETVHTARAKIEDMSVSGACFRLKIPIRAGAKVEVSWCRDKFTGITRWCREEHGDYLVGMQRDKSASKDLSRNVPIVQAPSAPQADVPAARRVDAAKVRQRDERDVSEADTNQVSEKRYEMRHETRQEVWPADLPSSPAPVPEIIQSTPPQRRSLIRRETLIRIQRPMPLPLLRITFPPAVIQKPLIGFEIAVDSSGREAKDSGAPYQKRTTSLFEERTEMPNKWINLGSKNQQKEGANGSGTISAAHVSRGMAGDLTLAPPRGDLLLLEDIYRTAGIMEPRMGYSITKVVEMLRSDHLRGLGDEVKRASVLMALTAAGIPLGDVLQDAAHRQAAVAAYEAEQRTKFEEYWARRAEENVALQSEMERVTRQFVERMNRNLTEVQQEKEAFQKWQTAMQHEVLRISEAVTLCAQPAVCESPAELPAAGSSESLVAKSA
jgi:hypothetical protein